MRLLDRLGERYRAQGYYEGMASGASVLFTYGDDSGRESSTQQLVAQCKEAYATNGIVYAVILARMMLFSEATFKFRSNVDKRLYGNTNLRILEVPAPNQTTGELLARMEQDVSLAGNSFIWKAEPDLLVRLPPDEVTIISTEVSSSLGGRYRKVIGYDWDPRPLQGVPGQTNKDRGQTFAPDEIAHWSPYPDPMALFRGMSWLTPVIREIFADSGLTQYKNQYLEHAATPNLIVKYTQKLRPDTVDRVVERFRERFGGVQNAWQPIVLDQGSDATVVGSSLAQLDYKAVQGAGEPLALDTPVPTPSGWTTMGEIRPGQQVIGRDGLPANVLSVLPVHVGRDCYRVTFNDRTSVVADGGHLWAAMDRNVRGRPETIFTTEELRRRIVEWKTIRARRTNTESGNRIAIPPGAAAKLPAVDLLVDPYVLGVWLGDGQTAGAAICGAADDLEFLAAEIERRGYTTTKWAVKPGKVPVIGLPGGFMAALDALGVLGDKRIPVEYLRASIEQRLDLLRGLMDTDGSVGVRGKETCEFSSKHQELAGQVAELARSLGQRVTVSSKRDARSRTGWTWRVTFRADPEMVPFLLPRKAARCVTPLHVRNRAIVSIEPVESVPVRCIATDAPDHLFYVGEGWVLTHNTRIAAAGGVPPIVVGLSEGLSSATYSNYQTAMRRFADLTMRPLWRSVCACLEKLVPGVPPAGVKLWYDTTDIAALRQSEIEMAQVGQVRGATLLSMVQAGYTRKSAVEAIIADDLSKLQPEEAPAVKPALGGAVNPNTGQVNPPKAPPIGSDLPPDTTKPSSAKPQTPAKKVPMPQAMVKTPQPANSSNGGKAK